MIKIKFTLILIAVLSVSLFTIDTVSAQENHSPVVNSFYYSPHLVQIMSPVNAIITFSDPDPKDTHTITWDWGDGETESGTESSSTHVYTEAGIYRISVTVTDNKGGRITMIHSSKIIVYDTLAGFTTGGGWVICPHPVTDAPTRGYFGFNAKYHENKVKGNVVFKIKDGLRFKSTSIWWLVITGENRVIYGLGILNGETECIFTVKVRDSGKDDGFDILLVNADTKEIIYDSYKSDYSTYYTVLPLKGGSVVTHNPPNKEKNANVQTGTTGTSQASDTPPQTEKNGKAYGKTQNPNSNKNKDKKPIPKNKP